MSENLDVMQRLQDADPWRPPKDSRWCSLEMAVLKNDVLDQRAPRAHRRVRRVVGATAALVLLGGAAAVAAHWSSWGAVATDGVTCMPQWVAPDTSDYQAAESTFFGGPLITGDPVADCGQYAREAGLPAIVDPTAVKDGGSVYVAPRSQVPATLESVNGTEPSVVELTAAVGDWVAGPLAGCSDPPRAASFANDQLTRLGMQGWTVTDRLPLEAGPCASLLVDSANREVVIQPRSALDHTTTTGGADPTILALRDQLARSTTGSCLSLAEAETLTTQVLQRVPHAPTAVITDENAACARAYLTVAGTVQVHLYGPTRAGH